MNHEGATIKCDDDSNSDFKSHDVGALYVRSDLFVDRHSSLNKIMQEADTDSSKFQCSCDTSLSSLDISLPSGHGFHQTSQNDETLIMCDVNMGKTKTSEGGLNVSGISKVLLEKVCMMERKLDTVEKSVEEIKFLLKGKCMMIPQHPEGLPELPLSSFDEAKIAEKLAKKEAHIKAYIVKKLLSANKGKNVKQCSKKVMSLLMTNCTGEFFNWRGGGGKEAFMNWTLKDMIITAVQMLVGSEMDMTACEAGIKEWLKGRKFRK